MMLLISINNFTIVHTTWDALRWDSIVELRIRLGYVGIAVESTCPNEASSGAR